MEAAEKVYGVHWEVEKFYPKWQLTSENWIRVDITKDIGSKYRIIAYTLLTEEMNEKVRLALSQKELCAETCGKDGWTGEYNDILDITGAPGEFHGRLDWRVTNCARLVPAYVRKFGKRQWDGDSLPRGHMFVQHPQDGFVVQFNSVPWRIFKRYWRKPIHLDKRFHSGRNAVGSESLNILNFDLTLLKSYKCFFADFSHRYTDRRKRTHDAPMADWMMENSRAFKIMSDDESPFTDDMAEFMFAADFLA